MLNYPMVSLKLLLTLFVPLMTQRLGTLEIDPLQFQTYETTSWAARNADPDSPEYIHSLSGSSYYSGDKYIPNPNCDGNGCEITMSESIKGMFESGAVNTFTVKSASLTDTIIEIQFPIIESNHELDFLFVHPEFYSTQGLVIWNQDEGKYEDCLDANKKWDGIRLPNGESIDNNWSKVLTKNRYVELAKECHDKFTFNNICACERLETYTGNEGIIVYKITEDFTFTGRMVVKIGNKVFDTKISSNDIDNDEFCNEDSTICVGIKLSNVILNPMQDKYVGVHYKRDENKLSVLNVISIDSAPSSGILTRSGLGQFQATKFRKPGGFDKVSSLDYEDFAPVNTGDGWSYINNEEIKTPAELIEFIDQNWGFRDSDLVSSFNLNEECVNRGRCNLNASNSIVQLAGSSCVRPFKSPSKQQLNVIVGNNRDFFERYGKYHPEKFSEVKILDNGYTDLSELKFTSAIKTDADIKVRADKVRVEFTKGEGVVKSWTYDKANVVVAGAGSFVTLSIDYVGLSSTISIESKEIVLYLNKVSCTTGKNIKTIAVKNSDKYNPDFTICIQGVCKRPEQINYNNPGDSSIDDPDVGNGENVNNTYSDLFSMLFSYWLSGLCIAILWIIDIVFAIILIWIGGNLIMKIYWFVIPVYSIYCGNDNMYSTDCNDIECIGYGNIGDKSTTDVYNSLIKKPTAEELEDSFALGNWWRIIDDNWRDVVPFKSDSDCGTYNSKRCYKVWSPLVISLPSAIHFQTLCREKYDSVNYLFKKNWEKDTRPDTCRYKEPLQQVLDKNPNVNITGYTLIIPNLFYSKNTWSMSEIVCDSMVNMNINRTKIDGNIENYDCMMVIINSMRVQVTMCVNVIYPREDNTRKDMYIQTRTLDWQDTFIIRKSLIKTPNKDKVVVRAAHPNKMTDSRLIQNIRSQLNVKGTFTISVVRYTENADYGISTFVIECTGVCYYNDIKDADFYSKSTISISNNLNTYDRVVKFTGKAKQSLIESFVNSNSLTNGGTFFNDKDEGVAITGGPIEVNCDVANEKTVFCYNEGTYYLMPNIDIDSKKTKTVNKWNDTFKLPLGIYKTNIFPNGKFCTGQIIIENGIAICSSDCCSYSVDNYRTINIIEPGSAFKIRNANINQFVSRGSIINYVSTSTKCHVTGFQDRFDCFKNVWELEYWLSILAVPIVIILVVIIYMIRMIVFGNFNKRFIKSNFNKVKNRVRKFASLATGERVRDEEEERYLNMLRRDKYA